MLIIFKFDWNLVTKPPPFHISLMWILSISMLILWTIWHFFIYPRLKSNGNFNQINDSSRQQFNKKNENLLENSFHENSKHKTSNCEKNGQHFESSKVKNGNYKKNKKYI
jgi:hypothetical protein